MLDPCLWIDFLLFGCLHSTNCMIKLKVSNFSAHTLEKFWLISCLLSKTWGNSTSCLLGRIPINELKYICIKIDFQLILRQALLANAIPETRYVLRCHLFVRLKWLVKFGELNQESVFSQFLWGSGTVMLCHDLHSYCVLTWNDFSVWTHHIVFDISGFYLQ